MESIIGAIIAEHGDVVVLIVAFCFMYLKITSLSNKVDEVYKNQLDHWKFHLCNNDKKGE